MKSDNKRKTERRVVVTGLGVVSSLGIGWQEFWKNLIAGKSGISRVEAFDTSGYDRHFAGEVKNFDPTQFMSKQKAQRIGRASQMAIAASKLALKDARLKLNDKIRKRTAVCIGTTTGEIGLLEKFNDGIMIEGKNLISKITLSVYPASSLSANIATEFNISGKNIVFATACASGNYAVGQAFDLIRSKRCDYALAGGADGFSRIVFTGFARMYSIAPEKCQPFDKNRKGMIPGEGAGIVILESLENAQRRKAKIYSEILGYGLSSDAYHMTNPSTGGIIKAVKKALETAGINESQVDYISAHGTATLENDIAECQAINRVFGKITKTIPISSIKSMLGHTMGAAAALETIACCLAIQNSEVPPTINYREKDPYCDINCVPNKGRKHKVRLALNNSQAFGGNNACVIFSAKSNEK